MDIKKFLLENRDELKETVEVVFGERKDKETGEMVKLKTNVELISKKKWDKILKGSMRSTGQKGPNGRFIEEVDTSKLAVDLIAECCPELDLYNQAFQDELGVSDPNGVLEKTMKPGEINLLHTSINTALGFDKPEDDKVVELKNS